MPEFAELNLELGPMVAGMPGKAYFSSSPVHLAVD
jgi:hypothetical protein